MVEPRIATLNFRARAETALGELPSLAEPPALVRHQIRGLGADVVCLQQVNGQERPNERPSLPAVAKLLAWTGVEADNVVRTTPERDAVSDERNLAPVSRLSIVGPQQLRNSLVEKPW